MESLELKILNMALIGVIALSVMQGLSTPLGRTLAAAQSGNAAEIPASMTLRDRTGETALELALAGDSPGAFSLLVPGSGFYKGTIPLQFSGKQIAHPNGSVPA